MEAESLYYRVGFTEIPLWITSLAASPKPAPGILISWKFDSAFSSEFNLLLQTCRHPKQPIALADGIDWQEFYRLSNHHGLVPLVYETLSRSPDAVPQNVLDALRLRSIANARQASWFCAELGQIVSRLQQASIEVVPYKGPTLAQLLYADVTSRQYSDLDLLVHARDVTQATLILQELGYSLRKRFTGVQEKAHLRAGYEYVFDSAHGRNLVELQWQVAPRFYCFPFDMEDLFQWAIPLELEGHTLSTLCPEDLLLVLCVHAAKHGWTKLSWFVDIAQLSGSRTFAWDRILTKSTRMGIRRIVAVAFLIVNRLLDQPIPTPLILLAEDAIAQDIVRERLREIADGQECDVNSPSYFRLMLRSRERWRDHARFLLRLALTPSEGEWSAVRLPPTFFPLYRLVRLSRLVSRTLLTS